MIDCDYCGESHADNSDRYPLEGCPPNLGAAYRAKMFEEWCTCATGSHISCPASDCLCYLCNDERL